MASTSSTTAFDWTPLVLSLMAGLSTCLGASVVCFSRRFRSSKKPPSHKHLSFSIAFAGSVMVTVSFFSLLPESFADDSTETYLLLSPASRLFWERIASFVAGCGLYLLLSKCAFPEPDAILGLQDEEDKTEKKPLISADTTVGSSRKQQSVVAKRQSSVIEPDKTLPKLTSMVQDQDAESEVVSCASFDDQQSKGVSFWAKVFSGTDLTTNESRRSWRVAMLLFVSLAVHNFPEGFCVAASSIHSPKLGVTTALAIAFHNIPEGIAIAVPCLAARPESPWLAFWLASFSGLAEPFGAGVALAVLRGFGDDQASSSSSLSTKGILSFVAGIMVMVSVNDLFPEAIRHSSEGKLPMIVGTVVGAVLMIASDAVLDATY